MATITFKGSPIQTTGELPAVGSKAPEFTLTNQDLAGVALSSLSGKKLVLNVFPSIDTPVCQASVRAFHEKVSSLDNCGVLCISRDLPFAQKRFCGAEGIEDIVTLSDFQHPEFGDTYGLRIADGPLQGLFARAVLVLDEEGTVVYTELVPEIAEEPDYDKAIAALS